ncbi:MAG: response regulator [Candidatus Latescibacterota bacterium]
MLLVDDARVVLEVLAQILRDAGYQVEQAQDGHTALQQVQRFRPHVLLCDLNLRGGMSGYDVARHVRSLPVQPRPVLIAMSANVREDLVESPEAAGFDTMLSKPFDVETLQRLMPGSSPPSPTPGGR